MNQLIWCKRCLAMSTRPRITFDENGVCNACSWNSKKREINWEERQSQLRNLLDKARSKDGDFDCLVPVSGGKDGSYVAHNLKNKYGMNPLCVTVTPALSLELGDKNLKSFVNSGFSHISVNPDSKAMQILNRIGFEQMGFPYYGWLISITTAPIRIALAHGISLIFYGEDGEVEYGGTSETEQNPIYDTRYQRKVYLEGGYEKILRGSKLTRSQLAFFSYPELPETELNKVKLTHWSYFENWDPYRNYLVAKEYCGLMEADSTNPGTFTNFAQNDQALYALHTYLMYLKFGFGRANQDACIEIRRGAMDREQAINLVKLYDGQYPSEHLDQYLDYYGMNLELFEGVLDKFANKDLFIKENKRWKPKFEIT